MSTARAGHGGALRLHQVPPALPLRGAVSGAAAVQGARAGAAAGSWGRSGRGSDFLGPARTPAGVPSGRVWPARFAEARRSAVPGLRGTWGSPGPSPGPGSRRVPVLSNGGVLFLDPVGSREGTASLLFVPDWPPARSAWTAFSPAVIALGAEGGPRDLPCPS